MASVDYKISNFDGLCFKSGLYVGTDTNYTKIINSSGAFIGSISATSISTTGTLSVTGISTFGAPLRGANGSSTAPTYSFTNATNYGWYWTGTALGVAANGANAGTIDSNGLWSIGTSGSSQTHAISGAAVTGNTASAGTFTYGRNVTDGVAIFSAAGGNITMYGSTHATKAGFIEFYPNGSLKGVVNAAGLFAFANTAVNASDLVNIGGNSVANNGITTTTQRGLDVLIVGTSAATTSIVGANFQANTDAASYTTALRTAIRTASPTKGSGSTITNDVGALIVVPTQGGTSNAWLTDTATPTAGSWGIFLSSSNANSLGGSLAVVGNFGANGQAPAARQTYTITNVTTDRSYDANATTLDEVADALGTLVADLRTIGLVA